MNLALSSQAASDTSPIIAVCCPTSTPTFHDIQAVTGQYRMKTLSALAQLEFGFKGNARVPPKRIMARPDTVSLAVQWYGFWNNTNFYRRTDWSSSVEKPFVNIFYVGPLLYFITISINEGIPTWTLSQGLYKNSNGFYSFPNYLQSVITWRCDTQLALAIWKPSPRLVEPKKNHTRMECSP